ncbi:hypothetical protein KKA39_01555 [Patescibacteria group bacterium]|nr:hypothetical protein [Patescibacteria group bacterium]MBU1727978.1 hypothetical protein [Patescibacteria group bacterium]
MLPENIIFIGVLINLICTIWYIRGIFRHGTRPNLISWFVWMLAPFVGVFLQLKAGAGLSSLSVLMAGVGPFLVIVFSIFKKNAFWKIQSFDLVCGFISIMALVLYIITNNLGISILFAILSDFLAYIPTFIKTWKYPETENSSIYIGGIIGNTLSLLIVRNWIFAIYSFPIYLVLANLVEVYFIYRKKFLRS